MLLTWRLASTWASSRAGRTALWLCRVRRWLPLGLHWDAQPQAELLALSLGWVWAVG
jgi:hypothetical protein